MNDIVLKLLDAVLTAYDKFHEPKNGQTFCNLSVDFVLSSFGYLKMRNPDQTPMVADQMIDFMSRSSDWEAVTMGAAQDLANAGNVVIAGINSTGLTAIVGKPQEHGHVVVVRPGNSEFSGKYGGQAPKVSHCGNNPYIGRGAEWSFPGATPPNFWLLKQPK